jgi:hypothetical protein
MSDDEATVQLSEERLGGSSTLRSTPDRLADPRRP